MRKLLTLWISLLVCVVCLGQQPARAQMGMTGVGGGGFVGAVTITNGLLSFGAVPAAA
jgi:hypothetical protein